MKTHVLGCGMTIHDNRSLGLGVKIDNPDGWKFVSLGYSKKSACIVTTGTRINKEEAEMYIDELVSAYSALHEVNALLNDANN